MAQNDNVKGITIQIGGDVQPLNDALKEASKKSHQLASELDSINKKLKLDPGNTDLLRQKQEKLNEAISYTEDQLNDVHKAWKNASKSLQNGDISEEQFKELGKQAEALEKKLDNYQRQLEKVNIQLGETADTTEDATDAFEDFGDTTDDVVDAFEDTSDSAEDVVDGLENVTKSGEDTQESMEGLSVGEVLVAANMKNIIVAVVELISKLKDYIIASDTTFSKMKDLNERISAQKKSYEETTKEMEINNTRLEAQAMLIGNLDKKLGDTNITEKEAKRIKQELAREVDAFNKAVGDSVLKIDDETGALDKSNKALKIYLDRIKKKAEYEASYSRLVEVMGEIREQQEIIDELVAKDNGSVFYEDLINNGKESLGVLQAEEEQLMGVISGYYEADEASSVFATSVGELSDAMAMSLLVAESRGAELSTLQQEELAGWKETHKQEVEDFNATVQKESEIHDARLQKTRDSNHEITLSYEQSLEERLRIMKHNQEVVGNYEDNLAKLREIALSQADEDTKQAMLGFLTTLTDYSQDSMEMADMMVKDFGDTGGEQAWAYINAWNDADVPGEQYDIGVQIMKDFKAGMQSQEKEVSKEAQNIADIVTRKLRSVKVSYSLSGSSAQNNWSFRPMAQGGIVTQPTFTLTGEAGPEAIIPLDRLGGIIESALGNSGGIGGGYTMNVYPQSMSPSEQEMLLDKFDRRFGDRTSRRAI